MNCTLCKVKNCRKLNKCATVKSDRSSILDKYHETGNQQIVQAAAELVDNNRAGTLNRLEEIIEFVKKMKYRRVGLVFCYGIDDLAAKTAKYLKKSGVPLSAVSCTAGSLSQKEINLKSDLHGVSCNPLSQAEQLNLEGVDFAIVMGLCLGHDILFTQAFKGDQTTLLVKDRTVNHNIIEILEKLT